jgi:homoserine kinase
MSDRLKSISATAPPTIANLAVGFDILGMAIQGEGDLVTASLSNQAELRITKITGDGGRLPLDPTKNTVTAGILIYLDDLMKKGLISKDIGIDIEIEKRMALGTGMGSSASSAAAGIMAVNALLGSPLNKKELSPYALQSEAVASGGIHGDNVIPALWGGMVLMRNEDPFEAVNIPSFPFLSILVIHPHVEVMTSESRARLAPSVPLKSYVRQSADLALFVHACHSGDIDLLRRCMKDHVIGPQREKDIPWMKEVSAICMSNNAINYNISGSGPSTFAFFERKEEAEKAEHNVRSFFEEHQMSVDLLISKVDEQGARIIDSRP